MIERQPHLPHTTPAPHLGPGSPHPSPSSARQVSEEAGVGGGGRQAGRGGSGSCHLGPLCVAGSVIYPWQGPAPERLAPHLPTRHRRQLL